MVAEVVRMRKQKSRRPQQMGARLRVRMQKNESMKELEKQAFIEKLNKIDKINLNKIRFRREQEQIRAQQLTEPQVGLPEMERREASQKERQARTDWAFRVSKRDSEARMGHEQERLETARKDHSFEPTEKDKDERVLKAGIKPIEEKKDNINIALKEEESEWTRESKAIFHSGKSPTKMRDELRALALRLRKAASGRKVLGRNKKLPPKAQEKRKKELLKRVEKRKIIEEYLRKTRRLGRGV